MHPMSLQTILGDTWWILHKLQQRLRDASEQPRTIVGSRQHTRGDGPSRALIFAQAGGDEKGKVVLLIPGGRYNRS